uniref:HSP100.6 n=1 Tax=Aeluropus littoralis TaxID=110874 RepID=A0A8G1GNT7_9POAL|nr:HSP100.6 [Aeluropus littoralis]
MRAGGCTVQQSLTADAATVVKQAVSLARRRGNAQVTPLHVASAMLAAPGGLLRAACLRSHSHPLQCKALELCFNVALNRLPASAAVASSPLLGGHGHHYYPPSLSNALVAAFKRAQAHQRRGSVESQQQPVLAVKIELEQLVVSILDDPSVSRVMREAGFSSTQVKANVEQAVCTTAATTAPKPNPNNPGSTATTASPPQETKAASKRPSLDHVRDDDVAAVLDCLAAQRKRRVVVVAESTAAAEALARAAVDKIKRAEARHDALRGAQVVSLRVSSFRDMSRDDAERRLGELRCIVRGSRGQQVLLVVEDLKWAAEFWAGHVQSGRRGGYYCSVEHVVTEVRALLACSGGIFWLVGFGTYQAYLKCRVGQPSLESLWGLQTLTVPAGGLALSLTCAFDDSALDTVNQSVKASPDSDGNGPASCWPLLGGSPLLSRCCGDCSAAGIEPKAALPRPFVSSSSLPSWLQHCRDNQESTHLTDLGKTWSSICSKPSQRMTLHFSAPVSPASSVSSYEHGHQLHQPPHSWLLTDLDAKHPRKPKCETSGKSRSNDSGPSIGSVEVECRAKFKELNAENLKVLCGALEKEVPWQKEIIPEIASTVLQCRSGIAKRRDKSRSTDAKEETWMFFLGGDTEGKETMARELANLVFGSRNNLLSIRLGAASSPSASRSYDEEHRSKRPRTSPAGKLAYLERLYQAVSENPHRVILMEDGDQADRDCELGIKEAIESGVVRNHNGEEVGLGDAIIILSCENFEARSRACSAPPSKQMKVEMEEDKEEKTSDHKHDKVGSSIPSCFDLNINVESDQVDEANVDDVCLLTAVDRTLFFKRQEHS